MLFLSLQRRGDPAARAAARMTEGSRDPAALTPPNRGADEAHPHIRLAGRRAMRLRFTPGNTITLLRGGAQFFPALIRRIDEARHRVAIETYMICHDRAGQALGAALMRAARRGVEVRLITDGIGTAALGMFAEWEAAGVRRRIYNPHLIGRFGVTRTHRKIALIDDRHGFVGGINFVEDFINDGQRLPAPRWDFALEIEGPLTEDIGAAIEWQWRRIGNEPPLKRSWPRWRHMPQGTSADRLLRVSRGISLAAFVARDNLVNRRAIEKAYLYAIGRASRQVLLANAYFVPGRRMRRALVEAAQRGVEVRLLVGRKEFAMLDHAVPFLYRSLLKAGVVINEYDKTLLHAKVAVVDDAWATVGSSNLDALSLLVNHEANVVIVDDPVVAEIGAAIRAALGEARLIDQDSYAARPLSARIKSWVAYHAYRLAMKLLTAGRYD